MQNVLRSYELLCVHYTEQTRRRKQSVIDYAKRLFGILTVHVEMHRCKEVGMKNSYKHQLLA